MDIVYFLYGDFHQWEVAYESVTFGWVGPDILSHPQTCLDMPRVLLDSPGGIARLRVIQNERLINLLVNENVFSTIWMNEYPGVNVIGIYQTLHQKHGAIK